MKLLEKFVLIIYSLLMLVISVIVCLLLFRIIDINNISACIDYVLADSALTIIVLATAIIFFLLSIRCIFFRKRKEIKKSTESEVLLENDAGRLLISKRAIENCVKNVITDGIESNPEVKVTVDIDPASNISTYISIVLDKSVRVKDFTIGLQNRIKEQIKEDFGLDVKQVNIKIDSAEKIDLKKEIQKNNEVENNTIEENKDVIEVASEVKDE